MHCLNILEVAFSFSGSNLSV
uniref:Uncharacterized protein n=1 Tax=Arundo donax TaxID=35708 RepID=A0A0A8YWJ9_ARUDO